MTDFNQAFSIAEKYKNQNKKIAFTNGCFDIIHVGHIRYLKKASECGDCLLVGLNSDSSVAKIKGSGRPLVSQDERKEILEAFECVDEVIIFDESTPFELIKAVKPDVIVKGGDWKAEDIIGKDIVEKNGGKTVTIEYIPGRSTTEFINKIKESKPR
ncbi:MAG: D-glycero-beta-D-manno-heptose 1-phosphate adenylyltransferase [Candidatus Auribacterota bacterium]|nr:D-glycero-beta-D-manno-heptose 1-phosphate adenylyltransferase [Candidatus Auribacterota bacterium]